MQARYVVLRLVASLWWRLLDHYSHWPYRLASLIDERLPEVQRKQAAEEVLKSDDCCIGFEVGAPLWTMACAVDDLMSPKRQSLLEAIFLHTKSQAIQVEERFKRVRTHVASNSGTFQHSATVASNRVLREVKTLHEGMIVGASAVERRRRRRVVAAQGRAAGKHQQPPKVRKRKLCAWNLFLRDRLAVAEPWGDETVNDRTPRVQAEAGVAWRAAGVSTRRRYEGQAARENEIDQRRLAQAQRRAARQRPDARAPWGLGDDQYGLFVALMREKVREAFHKKVNFAKQGSLSWYARAGRLARKSEHPGGLCVAVVGVQSLAWPGQLNWEPFRRSAAHGGDPQADPQLHGHCCEGYPR